jgi:hypothetical protein
VDARVCCGRETESVDRGERSKGLSPSHESPRFSPLLHLYIMSLGKCCISGVKVSYNQHSRSLSARPLTVFPCSLNQHEGTPVGNVVDYDGTDVCTFASHCYFATATRRSSRARHPRSTMTLTWALSLHRRELPLWRLRQDQSSSLLARVSAPLPS